LRETATNQSAAGYKKSSEPDRAAEHMLTPTQTPDPAPDPAPGSVPDPVPIKEGYAPLFLVMPDTTGGLA
jgi:hypothetical protein